MNCVENSVDVKSIKRERKKWERKKEGRREEGRKKGEEREEEGEGGATVFIEFHYSAERL